MAGRDRKTQAAQRLAYEAARIMADQREPDFERARRKAAERMGVPDRRTWPTNEAIAEALLAQRRLFLGADHAVTLRRLRTEAVAAMRVFARFSPRLVGALRHGAGGAEEGVQLSLYAERPEEVVFELMERRIPWEERERRFRYPGGDCLRHPVFRFLAGGTPVELRVLPEGALHTPPLDPLTERPERGATLAEVERLVGDDGG